MRQRLTTLFAPPQARSLTSGAKRNGAITTTFMYGNALVRKDGEFPLFDGQGSERTATNRDRL